MDEPVVAEGERIELATAFHDDVEDEVPFEAELTALVGVEGTSHEDDDPSEPVSGEDLPADLDGDGRYRDVTGDGRVGSNDVVTFFENLEEPVIQDNVEYFDFTDDGRVGFDDVIALFEHL